ncbi:MAG: amino acid adenylation domain-containing protein [Cellvibrionaceae bacterium]|nr:amino acid adenylation domain-containing protein [Cellvibrionaceae bacterium]
MQDTLIKAIKAGVKLTLDGNELRVNAPKGALNEGLRDELKQHKLTIIDYFRSSSVSYIDDKQLPQLIPDIDNRFKPFPLTDIQHAYWLGRSSAVKYGQVATHFYFELDGKNIEIERLNIALRQLIDRHDMLRAIVHSDGTQSILATVPDYEIKLNDCSKQAASVGVSAIEKTRDILSKQVLPADRWPLFDIRATALADKSVRLHISLDLLIFDAWSMFLVFREWYTLYCHPSEQLKPLGISYRDYVLAERRLADTQSWKKSNEYWMSRIESLPAAPDLPVRLNNKSITQAPEFSRRREHLPVEKWKKLQNRARAEGLTPSGLLLAAYAEVLNHWSHCSHFTLNLTAFNRLPLHADINDVVGDFTSLVLVEVDHRNWQSTFLERAKLLQKQLVNDLEHTQISGVEVMRQWSKKQANPLAAMMPIVFTSALVFDKQSDASLLEKFGSMVCSVSQTPQVWLDHQVMEVNGDLIFNWDAIDDVFEEGVLDAMFASYQTLILRLATDESVWHSQTAVELPEAMAVLRLETNATQKQYTPQFIHQGFLRAVQKKPDAIAIETSTLTISYRELFLQSQQVATSLLANGIRAGDPVAILMKKGWEQIAAVMGILIAGGAYLPVNASFPVRHQQELLSLSGVSQVIIQSSVGIADECMKGLQVISIEPTIRDIDSPLLLDSDEIFKRTTLDDLAYIIFTSGTTGVPKGVMIDHRSAHNTIEHINQLFSVSERDKVFCASSLSFDLSVYDIFGLLGVGGTLVIPDAAKRHDAVHWFELVRDKKVTLWNSAPQLMTMLLDSMKQPVPALDNIKTVLLSGDWIPVNLPQRIQEVSKDAAIVSLGGATEGSIWSIYHLIEAADKHRVSIPYGKPLPNQKMWVYDAALRPCPDYVKGKIFIGGDGVARGYWGAAEKTAESFSIHPETGQALYDTGDVGCYAANGEIIFLGRDDNQLKVRGHRVELGEIAAVLRRHKDIHEAVVLPAVSADRQELVAYLQADHTELVELGYSESVTEVLPSAHTPLIDLIEQAIAATDFRPADVDFVDMWKFLDQYYVSAMISALLGLGVEGMPGERIAIDRLISHGIAERYERWLTRAFAVLVEEGHAVALGESTIQLIKPLKAPDMVMLSAIVSDSLIKLFGFTSAQAQWFVSTVNHLQDVLTEVLHSAEIYASKEMASIYQKLFPDNHSQLVAVVQAICSQQQNLTVLEVGAGLGSATQHILPILTKHGSHYIFTDIAEFFLDRARNLFGDSSERISYQMYDVNRRPEFQGLEHHSIDLIVASSVLHDVQDVELALGNVLSLLKPGGKLLMLEETMFFRSFDLHMGLQQGFDGFTDDHLRQQHCILSDNEWVEAIKNSGFIDVSIVNTPGSIADYLGFKVMLASAPNTIQHLNTQLVEHYLEEQLPDYMVPRYIIPVHHIPIANNGKIDYKKLPKIDDALSYFEREIVAPRNDIESLLHKIWSSVIKVDEISVTDNFFDLGGDSLVATNLVREISSALPFTLEMHEFFENQTIEALADMYKKNNTH